MDREGFKDVLAVAADAARPAAGASCPGAEDHGGRHRGLWPGRRADDGRAGSGPAVGRELRLLLAGDSHVLYLNEVNTIPGFTTISMYSKMWDASGLPYAQLLDRLIALAIERHGEKQQLRTSM